MKAIVLAGGLVTTAMVLTGCGLQNITKATDQAILSYEVKEKVARLVLVGGAGEVVISAADGGVVKVAETLRWTSAKPTTEHKVEGDALAMRYDCPKAMDNCSVDYTIEVPKGMAVDVATGSGDIRLQALGGPVKAKVGSGDLEGTGLTGTEIKVEAGSGDTTLKYATTPDSVDLVVGSGNTKIELPGGPYNVDAKARSGDATVSVKTDLNSPHKVVARAGSGDVSVLPG
ncbi:MULTISPECIES: DUF4097 family beta strand repeat-containing protein [unclassified Nonomuraea]|uniref:DUF4097 family beta strand repeat-containing protein n=1 Tax=unclassified Nonomuraea TaxID=2593643 RepID=UPI0033C36109